MDVLLKCLFEGQYLTSNQELQGFSLLLRKVSQICPGLHSLTQQHCGLTVGRINIGLSLNDAGDTDAEVTYRYTAISAEGEEFVRGYSEEYFEKFMQFSEASLNEFLARQ